MTYSRGNERSFMEVLLIITIILFMLGIIFESRLTHHEKKRTKVLEEQNILLRAILNEVNQLMKETIRETTKKKEDAL